MVKSQNRRNRSAYRSDYYWVGMSPCKSNERPERAAHMQDDEPVAKVHYDAALPMMT